MLLAKKRYVGFKLESVKQKLPTFDAKGIETVRRDGVPVQVKLIEVVLRYAILRSPQGLIQLVASTSERFFKPRTCRK
jgi:DNA polymerase zeta